MTRPATSLAPLPARTCACRRPLVDRHDRDDYGAARCVRCGRTVLGAANRGAKP